jgi:hypothetical protein
VSSTAFQVVSFPARPLLNPLADPEYWPHSWADVASS